MYSIHKYPLLGHDVKISIPEQAQLLHLKMQGDSLMAWFLVDLEKPKVERNFHVMGTGWEVDEAFVRISNHVGTVHDRSFVWHVFEVWK